MFNDGCEGKVYHVVYSEEDFVLNYNNHDVVATIFAKDDVQAMSLMREYGLDSGHHHLLMLVSSIPWVHIHSNCSCSQE